MDSSPGCKTSNYQRKPLTLSPEKLNSVSGHHKYIFHVKAPKMVILFAATAFLCLSLSLSSTHLQMVNLYNSFPFAAEGGRNQSTTLKEEKPVDLRSILKKAAMNDKTVIITVLNRAWAEQNNIFDLFLESFRIGYRTQALLKHLVVITLDKYAYDRCSQLHSHCYAYDTNGTDFSREAQFMKPDYLNLVWWKVKFLGSILRLGYNFLFTDADIMWFRNPFPHFHAHGDFQIACDNFSGNPFDIHNLPNAGFKFVKSNNRSIEFYKFWYDERERFPGAKTQDVLNRIKYDPFIRKIRLQIRFLDTAYYGGFCQASKDLNKVCIMHANCCIGMNDKILDLGIMLDDWRKYMTSQMNGVRKNISWTVPQHCSMASFNFSAYELEERGKQSKSVEKSLT